MKKSIFLILLGSVLIKNVNAAEPHFVETTIKYNSVNQRYEVYAKFDVNGPTTLGMSMLTVILPAECPDIMLSCQSHNGGLWVDNSRTFNENGYDYHGLITSGISNFGFLANKEQKLFDFELPQGVSYPEFKARLWNSKIDIKETTDGTDFRSNFYIAKSGYYLTPEVYESSTIGINELEVFQLGVYPNPANEYIRISAELKERKEKKAKVELINVEGRVVTMQEWDILSSHQLDMNVKELPEGTYQVQVTYQNTSYSTSFIKVNE